LRRPFNIVASLLTGALMATAASAGHGNGGGGTAPPPTVPPVIKPCGATDITAPSVTMLSCGGFYSGNLLNQSNSGVDQAILQSLGYYKWDGKITDVASSVDHLNGTQNLKFNVALTGISILAVHYGGGNGSPKKGQDTTAFYVLDAAQGVNQLHLTFNASSNAILFVTGLPRHIAAAPEPSSWVTMIAGFGMIGTQMRRRKRASAIA
jgi:hypothetical protein